MARTLIKMKYVLIWILTTGPSGISSGSQEFNNQEACESAKLELRKESRWHFHGGACVPKGKEK